MQGDHALPVERRTCHATQTLNTQQQRSSSGVAAEQQQSSSRAALQQSSAAAEQRSSRAAAAQPCHSSLRRRVAEPRAPRRRQGHPGAGVTCIQRYIWPVGGTASCARVQYRSPLLGHEAKSATTQLLDRLDSYNISSGKPAPKDMPESELQSEQARQASAAVSRAARVVIRAPPTAFARLRCRHTPSRCHTRVVLLPYSAASRAILLALPPHVPSSLLSHAPSPLGRSCSPPA